jgi:hypothetical protein
MQATQAQQSAYSSTNPVFNSTSTYVNQAQQVVYNSDQQITPHSMPQQLKSPDEIEEEISKHTRFVLLPNASQHFAS